MRFKLKLLFVLVGSFILLAPTSVSEGSAISEAAKYMRLLTTVLTVGIGLTSLGELSIGPACRWLILFVVMFVGAGVWSNLPGWALFNKSMFGLTCLSGVVLACSLRTEAEMRAGLRILGVVACIAAGVALLMFLKDPSAGRVNNRMAVFGINPNMIGHTASPLSILCMYVAMSERRWLWRGGMIFACCVLGMIILATGCRGAALTMMAGSVCLVAPQTRRPGVLLAVVIGAVLVGYIGTEVLSGGNEARIIKDMGRNTRSGIWKWAMKYFYGSPLIGCGWIHIGKRSGTVQSMYIQVLAESGILGAGALLTTLGVAATRWLGGIARLRRAKLPTDVCFLALAILTVELVHGLTESGPVVGTMMSALNLGLAVGLMDRAPALVMATRARTPTFPGQNGPPAVRRRQSAQEILEGWRQEVPALSVENRTALIRPPQWRSNPG